LSLAGDEPPREQTRLSAWHRIWLGCGTGDNEHADLYRYEHWQTALGAQRALARTGQHRAVGIADLLTATLAAAHQQERPGSRVE
jgi:hypothetical protein